MMNVYLIAIVCFCSGLAASQETYSFDSNYGDPCNQNPCGVNTRCEVRNGRVYCLCKPGFIPLPDSSHGCARECQRDSHCQRNKICHNYECVNPCLNVVCGANAFCDGTSGYGRCRCKHGYSGNPRQQCLRGGRGLFPTNPCNPNPCGSNTQCRVRSGRPACACLPGYRGNPRTKCTRGDCQINEECPSHRACVDAYCVDPCYLRCGNQASCEVFNHIPVCTCPPGTTGDPSDRCVQDVSDPCDPNPCGENTACESDGRRIRCRCADGFVGSPLSQCRRECEANEHCAYNKVCRNFRCDDPCDELCGENARCTVRNHVPSCSCPRNYLGDAYTRCYPECVQHLDCGPNKACYNFKCADPCEGACGINATCEIDNLVAKCSCPDNYVGHALVSCRPFVPEDLCVPNPCGFNANCQPGKDREGNDRPVCSCMEGYRGNALVHCRKGECIDNNDCPDNRQCYDFMCENPCRNDPCGVNAECLPKNHGAVCRCLRGYQGNALRQCYRRRRQLASFRRDLVMQTNATIPSVSIVNLCTPNPCGINARCEPGTDQEGNDRPVCFCTEGYGGDPLVECSKRECVENSDCPEHRACLKSLCVDPCGTHPCGDNTQCMAKQHKALCRCLRGYVGDPFNKCVRLRQPSTGITTDVCRSVCGQNTDCESIPNNEGQDRAVCTCRPGYTGDPYVRCYTQVMECETNLDCPYAQSCVANSCTPSCESDPCGRNTKCSIVNDTLKCDCLEGYEPIDVGFAEDCHRSLGELCNPNPCGSNAECKPGKHHGVTRPLCFCLPGFTGDSTKACLKLGEVCSKDNHCADNRTCINDKCVDPCKTESCGQNAECLTQDHRFFCECLEGFHGDPWLGCVRKGNESIDCVTNYECPINRFCSNGKCEDPCKIDTCGENAHCTIINHRSVCHCMEGFEGNPWIQCVGNGSCITHTQCPDNKACMHSECVDPCIVCGANADCEVIYRSAICYCPEGYFGDPFIKCIRPANDTGSIDHCSPTPCGKNTKCTPGYNEQGEATAVCACKQGYSGDPLIECIKQDERSCVHFFDCPDGWVCEGNTCVDGCNPNPCGENTNCSFSRGRLSCTCLEGYDSDTPELGCKRRLQDVYCNPNPCGVNAECKAGKHGGVTRPLCYCPSGFTGDSRTFCSKLGAKCRDDNDCADIRACVDGFCDDPCKTESCGQNAECTVRNHWALCECPPGFQGDPWEGCYSGNCTTDDQCPSNRFCNGGKCDDPCEIDICGQNAACLAVMHRVTCQCLPGFQGDPYVHCG